MNFAFSLFTAHLALFTSFNTSYYIGINQLGTSYLRSMFYFLNEEALSNF